MKGLLDALPAPVWARDNAGQLVFVNSAYARAVEAETPADAVARRLELLDQAARTELSRARIAGETYIGKLPAIAAGGRRRIFEVVDAPSGAGTSGIAIDRTEVEVMRDELARMAEAHRPDPEECRVGHGRPRAASRAVGHPVPIDIAEQDALGVVAIGKLR